MTLLPDYTPCTCTGQCHQHAGPCEHRHRRQTRHSNGQHYYHVLYSTPLGPLCGRCKTVLVDEPRKAERQAVEEVRAVERSRQAKLFGGDQ